MTTALLDRITSLRQPSLPRFDADNLFAQYRSLPSTVRETWKELVQKAVREDRGDELHASRSQVEYYVIENIAALAEFVELGKKFVGSGHPVGSQVAQLEQGLCELKRFREELFERWATADDLYSILVEQFPYSKENFDRYVATHPIPQSWYDETDDLFSPAPE